METFKNFFTVLFNISVRFLIETVASQHQQVSNATRKLVLAMKQTDFV